MRSLFLGAALAVALSTPAVAVTIIESTDFDFSANLANPTNLGLLDLGANSISGRVSATCIVVPSNDDDCGFFRGDDGDAVAFEIGAGLQLSAATLTISHLEGTGGGNKRVFASSFTSLKSWGTIGAGVFDLLSGGPLTGTQNYGVFPVLFEAARGDTISFNWRLGLTVTAAPVSAVPLPAGMPLLLAGLASLAVLRRRTPRA